MYETKIISPYQLARAATVLFAGANPQTINGTFHDTLYGGTWPISLDTPGMGTRVMFDGSEKSVMFSLEQSGGAVFAIYRDHPATYTEQGVTILITVAESKEIAHLLAERVAAWAAIYHPNPWALEYGAEDPTVLKTWG